LCGTGSGLGVRDEAIAHMREVTRGRAPRPFDPKRLAPGAAPELMRRAYFESIQTDPRTTLGDLEASLAFSKTVVSRTAGSSLGSAMPVLVVAGECEPEADLEAAHTLAARHGARFATLAKAAHWLPLEQPAALAAEIATLAEAA
jgi:pimeloyl-ACP methyl ester carboxylesterase